MDEGPTIVILDEEKGLTDAEEEVDEAAILQALQVIQSTDIDVELLEERNREFGVIRSSIKSIHDIQKDLAMLVEAQQEDVDDLEAQAAQSAEQAEEGLESLVDAAKKQEEANELAFILLVGGASLLGAASILWLF